MCVKYVCEPEIITGSGPKKWVYTHRLRSNMAIFPLEAVTFDYSVPGTGIPKLLKVLSAYKVGIMQLER